MSKKDEEVTRLNPEEEVRVISRENVDDFAVDFAHPEPEQMSLKQFETKIEKMPWLGFNAYQRLYASLRMHGFRDEKHNRRWGFLDDPINIPGAPRGELAVYGHEDVANELMSILDRATIDLEQKRRYVLLTGPTGSSKTSLVKNMAKALDVFGMMPEGAVYTVEYDFSEEMAGDLFQGLRKITCPTHENPLNFLDPVHLDTLLGKLEVPQDWQEISATGTPCPACTYVMQTLNEAGVDLDEVLKVRRLYKVQTGRDRHATRLIEVRPTHEKGYDPAKLFGGNPNFSRFKMFLEKEHPLVTEYGLGGFHMGPSAQRHMIHFSEMLKNDPKCLEELLDTIQERKLEVHGNFVDLDAVMMCTSNLEEYTEKGDNKKIAYYFMSRGRQILVPQITVRSDMDRALKNRVFDQKKMQGTHIPPHFVKHVMATLGVMSAIEETGSFETIGLESKMKIYDHECPPGFESDLGAVREELLREATKKPIGDIVEGVQLGITFKMFQDSVGILRGSLQGIDIPEELQDPNYKNCLTHLGKLHVVLDDILSTYEAINPETRSRALEQLPESLKIWQRRMADDVNIALMGNETMITTAAKYIAMVFAMSNKERKYIDPRTRQSQNIDEEFVNKIDAMSGMRSPKEFRQAYAHAHRYRVGVTGSSINDVKELAEVLLQEQNTFRDVVHAYVTHEILPRSVDNISTAYSPDNDKLVRALMEGGPLFGFEEGEGYCKGCANLAINAAAVIRKKADGGEMGVYNLSECSGSSCGSGGCNGC